MMKLGLAALALLGAVGAGGGTLGFGGVPESPLPRIQDDETSKLLKDAKITLSDAIALGLKEAKEGFAFKAELEKDKVVHWAIDVAQGQKVIAIDIDVQTGKVVETDSEALDRSNVAKASKISLVQAIETALKKVPGGQAISAEIKLEGEKATALVKVYAKGKLKSVLINAQTGELAAKAKGSKKDTSAKGFTDTFPNEDGQWASTGRNAYFILEPGYFQIFEGKENGLEIRTVITVLAETKKIAGVETRVVEDRVTKGDQISEIARDYYAFSKKTGNIYYFGEDVDNYKNGQLANHEGSWLAGEKGARYGLMMPGTPLLGARFYQELAPGVGMDRIEIVSLSDAVETPAGRFEHCVRTEETSPLEPGVTEYKLWAPGVGIVADQNSKLVKYGMKKD